MIQIYRIDHISQVVPELEPIAELYEKLFGFVPVSSWENEAEGSRGRLYELPESRGQRWELLEPMGPDSPLTEFIDSPLGPGIHHIAVETNDMKVALGELDRLGLTPVAGSDAGPSTWFDVPIAPPSDGSPSGLLLRLLAAPAEKVCGDDRGSWPHSPKRTSSATETDETIGVTELMHVCQAIGDLDALAVWNERLLGMQPIYRTPEGKHPDMATMMLSVPGSGIIWEMIAPEGEDSFIERFLEKRGPASCHHVTFEVRDWDRAMAACERQGVPVFGESTGETDGAKWRDAFIHPKHLGGALVQLYYEERPGVWMRSDKVPAVRKAV